MGRQEPQSQPLVWPCSATVIATRALIANLDRVGNNTHAMTYSISKGELFNMVLTHPEPNDDPATWDQANALRDMKAVYSGWDPT